MMGSRNEADMKHYLEEHRLHVSVQIEKLKVLKVDSSSELYLLCLILANFLILGLFESAKSRTHKKAWEKYC